MGVELPGCFVQAKTDEVRSTPSVFAAVKVNCSARWSFRTKSSSASATRWIGSGSSLSAPFLHRLEQGNKTLRQGSASVEAAAGGGIAGAWPAVAGVVATARYR